MPHRAQRDRAETWLLAGTPVPTGLVIVLFSDRFTSRSWRFAGGIPGGYAAWAGVLIISGVAMLVAMIGIRGPQRQVLLTAAMAVAFYWIWVYYEVGQ